MQLLPGGCPGRPDIPPGKVDNVGNDSALAEGVELAAHSAKEINRDGLGVIRFYHDGGASGGGIDITRNGAEPVKIAVDWLVGRVEVDFGRSDA